MVNEVTNGIDKVHVAEPPMGKTVSSPPVTAAPPVYTPLYIPLSGITPSQQQQTHIIEDLDALKSPLGVKNQQESTFSVAGDNTRKDFFHTYTLFCEINEIHPQFHLCKVHTAYPLWCKKIQYERLYCTHYSPLTNFCFDYDYSYLEKENTLLIVSVFEWLLIIFMSPM